ncbi:serine hydrolase-like protein isoform X4 [Onthophagus taurus]|uniref:serine hydrolase-like protein isoform X4 n=1 Tax=Onthophagus taurus TaxID=166361 RepID=UPI000C206C8D|nr:serine hydrolase-like protein isoform X2 [Onthophagus taurus]
MKIEELRIPAPWGHIAVKSWNDIEYETIIVTHGYTDNAGSFDRLIPKLPNSYHYACVDLPGHGFSSYFNESLPVQYTQYLMAYKSVAEYFKKEKYILLGHSFGAQLGLLFAQLYPKFVSKVISLDSIYYASFSIKLYMEHIKAIQENYLTTNNDRKTYTYEEAFEKVRDLRIFATLTDETTKDLFNRMVIKNEEGKYVITNDKRLPLMPCGTDEYNVEFFKRVPVQCPVLILLTKNNQYNDLSYKLRKYFEQIGFIIKRIEGDHHVHQTNPDEIAEIVTEFLMFNKSKY